MASSSRRMTPPTTSLTWRDDPSNPHNWPARTKYMSTILLSAFSFNTLMSSTIIAPALSRLRQDLHITGDGRSQLVLSIFVLSYTFGYFLWAPLSEVYGRKPILALANIWFCIWNLVCGFSTNEATFTAGRLFSGAGAAASLAISTGVLGEVWLPEQCGRSHAVLSSITLLGPCVGPILGGMVSQHCATSWRWAFWLTTMFNVCLHILSLRFLQESHKPTILRRQLKYAQCPAECTYPTMMVLVNALRRPFLLFLTQPASQGLTLFMGISFGGMYVVLTVIPVIFTEIYEQSLSVASLNYLSFGTGMILGAQMCAPVIDILYKRKARQNESHIASSTDDVEHKAENFRAPPELRLYPFIPTVLFTVIGFTILGWSLRYHMPWIIPNIGIAIFGAGSQAMTQCTNAYVIDTFSEIKNDDWQEQNAFVRDEGHTNSKLSTGRRHQQHFQINWSASALAMVWASKSAGGFAFPLFALDIIHKLGWGWSFTLLALLNLIIGLPVGVLLLVRGASLREAGRKKIAIRLQAGQM